ncbi:hypothetical protein AC249_AIPGENE28884 [Exaiptasia diaphana]|nr:hypothetical protein AC249_AIPGENE28884 [Exaiptasia diaphana]
MKSELTDLSYLASHMRNNTSNSLPDSSISLPKSFVSDRCPGDLRIQATACSELILTRRIYHVLSLLTSNKSTYKDYLQLL